MQAMFRTKLCKNLFLLFFFVMLSACGFKPIYAQHDNSALNQIFVEEIPTREGQVLRNELQDLLASTGYVYRLQVELERERRESGIQEDLRVSRYDIILKASYRLLDDGGSVVMRDTSKIYSSYNRTSSEFSTFVAEEDATEKAAEQLAYEIRGKLAAYFSN